jgi:methylmalonyl-CoA/ethylmalonyl-CoA epimerase
LELPLDHVAIAVADLGAAQPLYEALLGVAGSPVERVDAQGVDVVFIGEGAGRIELIAPTGPDTPVARHLERRGPGLHHLAYRVPDLEAALRTLTARGVLLIDERPRAGAHGRRVAFVHPKGTGGVLIELVEEQPAG